MIPGFKKLACVLLIGVCFAPKTVSASANKLTADTIRIGLEQNKGKTSIKRSKKGTIISVELGGFSGGTGYAWIDKSTSSPVLSFMKTELLSTDSSLMGAPARRVFLYEVTGNKGSSKLEFSLQRPWEKTSVRTFVHRVRVCGKK